MRPFLFLLTLLPPFTYAGALDPHYPVRMELRLVEDDGLPPVGTLDPRYPGVWEQTHELPNGNYHLLYTVRPNGTYTLRFKRPDRMITDKGTLEAANGVWTARSITGEITRGRYKFPDEDTLVTTTFLGNSTWKRVRP